MVHICPLTGMFFIQNCKHTSYCILTLSCTYALADGRRSGDVSSIHPSHMFSISWDINCCSLLCSAHHATSVVSGYTPCIHIERARVTHFPRFPTCAAVQNLYLIDLWEFLNYMHINNFLHGTFLLRGKFRVTNMWGSYNFAEEPVCHLVEQCRSADVVH